MLPLLLAGGLAITTVLRGSSYLIQKEKTEQAEIEAQKQIEIQKSELEQLKLEAERQKALSDLSQEKVVSLSDSKLDDFFLFLRENVVPVVAVISGVLLISIYLGKSK